MERDGYDLFVYGPSRHGTYNFNVFVMMTVFNFINARKLNDEINVFEGIFASTWFLLIVGGIFLLQVIIVFIGNIPFGCARGGLGIRGWLICIGVGMLGLLWRMVLRMFPEEKSCPKVTFYWLEFVDLINFV